eukprot:4434959-Amphidinium_carterae.1
MTYFSNSTSPTDFGVALNLCLNTSFTSVPDASILLSRSSACEDIRKLHVLFRFSDDGAPEDQLAQKGHCHDPVVTVVGSLWCVACLQRVSKTQLVTRLRECVYDTKKKKNNKKKKKKNNNNNNSSNKGQKSTDSDNEG